MADNNRNRPGRPHLQVDTAKPEKKSGRSGSTHSSRRFSIIDICCLGQPGYGALIIDLKGDLSKFNGQKCTPWKLPDGKWVAKVEDGMDTMEICLAEKHFTVIPFRNKSQPDINGNSIRRARKQTTIGLNNRSSVQIALESLGVEIQSAITRHSEKGSQCDMTLVLKAKLKEFDRNHDGIVSKRELVDGCERLGIGVTHQAVDLMWPLFKPDSETDGVQLEDFMSIVMQTIQSKKDVHLAQALHVQTTKMGTVQRRKRIKQKSEQFRMLLENTTMLQALLTDLMKKLKLNPKTMFDTLDYDQGGSIDPEEFRGFLKFHHLEFTKTQVALLWPMICTDQSGEMGFEEFSALLKISKHSGWSTSMMEDRFSMACNAEGYEEILGVFAAALGGDGDGDDGHSPPSSPTKLRQDDATPASLTRQGKQQPRGGSGQAAGPRSTDGVTQLRIMHRKMSILLTPPARVRTLDLGGSAPLPTLPASPLPGAPNWTNGFPPPRSPQAPQVAFAQNRFVNPSSPRSPSSLPSLKTYPLPDAYDAHSDSFTINSPTNSRASTSASQSMSWADQRPPSPLHALSQSIDALNPNQRKIVLQGGQLKHSFFKMQSVAKKVEYQPRSRTQSDPGRSERLDKKVCIAAVSAVYY
jgi:Ca2+-binding EF-hand superfamily protein